MDTVGIPVSTRHTRQYSTSSLSSALRYSPSDRCVIVANDIRKLLDIFSGNSVCFEDTLSTRKKSINELFLLVLFCFNLFLFNVYINKYFLS
jgi:hypothetical protein